MRSTGASALTSTCNEKLTSPRQIGQCNRQHNTLCKLPSVPLYIWKAYLVLVPFIAASYCTGTTPYDARYNFTRRQYNSAHRHLYYIVYVHPLLDNSSSTKMITPRHLLNPVLYTYVYLQPTGPSIPGVCKLFAQKIRTVSREYE